MRACLRFIVLFKFALISKRVSAIISLYFQVAAAAASSCSSGRAGKERATHYSSVISFIIYGVPAST